MMPSRLEGSRTFLRRASKDRKRPTPRRAGRNLSMMGMVKRRLARSERLVGGRPDRRTRSARRQRVRLQMTRTRIRRRMTAKTMERRRSLQRISKSRTGMMLTVVKALRRARQ